jgi:arabinan endo-1,5-alpha-L-arabinosidase
MASSRVPRFRLAAVLVALALLIPLPAAAATGTYRNPILPAIPGDGVVESCADPIVIRGQEGERDPETGELLWFMYCTTDPLNDEDRLASEEFHFVPMFSSTDLVNWTYEGDAFAERPDWVGDVDFLWAPEVTYMNGQYYLYFGASWTDAGGSAIGVATSDSPLGPWTDSGDPVVDPICCFQWVFDPEIVMVEGEPWIFFGSYFGGIRARPLIDNGTETIAPEAGGEQVQITIDNRYEGAEVVFKDGWYYLFVSASNCCNGPLTGYGVFVGRSADPLGPYVDRDGVSLLDPNVGGTPVIYQNGNRWVGPGHNTVFQDFDGQWWTMYHAIDVEDPYFREAVGFTKRPAMLDAIDWVDGWPVLNGGAGPSDTPQQAPAAQPGERTNHRLKLAQQDRLGKLIWADEFDDGEIGGEWSWVETANGTEADDLLTMEVQRADLHTDSNTASVLVTDAPDGNFAVEIKVRLNVPDDCCFNFSQAGLVLYEDDDSFIKAVEFANWNTRQGEFAKEVSDAPDGFARYGNMVTGPVGDEWTWFRVVKRDSERGSVEGPYGGDERYTVYTSLDGETWTRGGTWAHDLGDDLQIGLVAMGALPNQDNGGPPPELEMTADFDYVRVYQVHR